MPVGTRGAVKALTHARPRGRRRVHHPGQHLSPVPASGRRARSPGGAVCTGSSGGRARFSPTAAATRSSASAIAGVIDRAGRAIPFAPRRQRAPAVAGARRRHPGAASAPTSRWCSTSARRTRSRTRQRASRWSGRCAGRGGAATRFLDVAVRTAGPRVVDQPRPGAVRHRPGRRVPGPARPESARRTVEIGFEAYAIGGLSVGEPVEVMYDVVSRTAPQLPADRPRYLMGTGHARRPGRVRGARHRHVRLRAADAQRAQRPAAHPPRPAQHQERAVRRGRPAARRRVRAATRAGTSPGRISATSSRSGR